MFKRSHWISNLSLLLADCHALFNLFFMILIDPFYDPRLTWYKITHVGKQVSQWDFENKLVCFGRYCAQLRPQLYHVTGLYKGPIYNLR